MAFDVNTKGLGGKNKKISEKDSTGKVVKGHVHKKMGKIGCFSPLRVCIIQWQS